jgi:CheY-like chemotaxis protein
MSKNTFKASVLVIEDVEQDYNDIVSTLSKCNYQIIPISARFQEMRNAMSNCNYKWFNEQINNNYNNLRAIICDLNLVGNKQLGEDVIQYIRAMELDNQFFSQYTRFIPIVIYTGHATELAGTAIMRGGTLYINKKSKDALRHLADIVKKHVDNFSFLCNNLILKRPFKIGLTFRSENSSYSSIPIPQRPFIEEIANKLAHKYGTDSVFYDAFHPDRLNGLKADKKLDSFYREQCDYILVFLSADYTTSKWTGIEWKAVKAYASTHKDKIMLFLLEKFNTDTIKELDLAIYKDATEELNKFNMIPSQAEKDGLIKQLVDDIVIKKMES